DSASPPGPVPVAGTPASAGLAAPPIDPAPSSASIAWVDSAPFGRKLDCPGPVTSPLWGRPTAPPVPRATPTPSVTHPPPRPAARAGPSPRQRARRSPAVAVGGLHARSLLTVRASARRVTSSHAHLDRPPRRPLDLEESPLENGLGDHPLARPEGPRPRPEQP